MTTLKTFLSAWLISLVGCVSCSKSTSPEARTDEASPDSATAERQVDLSPPPPKDVLKDTLGLHKLTATEAREYIVDMYTLLSQIDQAVDEKALNRMPALMDRQRALQHKQLAIQNPLSEADRVLFKVYANRIADKLDSIATKIERM